MAEDDSANTSDTVTQASAAQAGAGGAAEAQTDTSEDTAGTGEATSTGLAGNSGAGGSGDEAGTSTDGVAQQGAKSTQGEVPLPKSDHEKQQAARVFAERWKGAGEKEIADTQGFWRDLLRDVFGCDSDTLKSIIQFEKPVYVEGHKKSIDGFITLTSVMGTSRILIEQKKRTVDMTREGRQSGGAMLSPYQQAKRYADNLPLDEKPRWIVTCNFREFWVYDMKKPSKELGKSPEVVSLKDFESEWYRLAFLADPNKEVAKRQEAASRQTGQLIGDLHKLMKSKMRSPDDKEALRCLNVFCVRLVFCFYAEDTGLFGGRTAFEDFIKGCHEKHIRGEIKRLFDWLDTPKEKRGEDDIHDMGGFDYVDGGLFADKDTPIPFIDGEVTSMIEKCGEADWSEIDPVIFGSIFESTLNPQTRHEGGMHYTSPANIDKVLDPLFMDELTAELAAAKRVAGKKARDAALHAFQDKLAALTFLDPACGSGNFLTRAYTRLRTLENEAILAMSENADIASGQAALGTRNPVKVSLDQFWGIEINDFAVSVAKTALWIAERQMLQATERIVGRQMDFLPISTQTHIAEGNALQLDWGTMEGARAGLTVEDTLFADVGEGDCLSFDYIMGNPPFLGARVMSEEQKRELVATLGKGWQNAGNLDYVTGWYKKAAEFIKGSATRCAFVSTNSITQGEQVAALWKPLVAQGVHIDFAWRTFKWQNAQSEEKAAARKDKASAKSQSAPKSKEGEAGEKHKESKVAAVHCVVVGFSVAANDKPKVIYEVKGDDVTRKEVTHINGYLMDTKDVFVESRQEQISGMPEIGIGNKPIDGGNYLFTEGEMNEFLKAEPEAKPYFHKWYGADEFINRRPRWCLYLGDLTYAQVKKLPLCKERSDAVREYRLKSKSAPTQELANTPRKFHVTNMPKGEYIIIPRVSSEKRKYVPMGFLPPSVLTSDSAHIIPDATLYHFGVLTSSVHMAWMRAVAGRLKSDYRYSKDIVYNNFVWSDATDEQRARIEKTAQDILTARDAYPDETLADLYGKDMYEFPKLLKAHTANDRAVLAAYGWPEDMAEADIVAHLMELYQQKAGD